MLVAILSDTHDDVVATEFAVNVAASKGAEALFHCGDITSPPVLEICCRLPTSFVLGNHDADTVPALLDASSEFGATCLGWGGLVRVAGRTIAVAHGHLTSDLQPLIDADPDYLLSGHFHEPSESRKGNTRRICPGALHRAEPRTFALLDTVCDIVEFVAIEPEAIVANQR